MSNPILLNARTTIGEGWYMIVPCSPTGMDIVHLTGCLSLPPKSVCSFQPVAGTVVPCLHTSKRSSPNTWMFCIPICDTSFFGLNKSAKTYQQQLHDVNLTYSLSIKNVEGPGVPTLVAWFCFQQGGRRGSLGGCNTNHHPNCPYLRSGQAALAVILYLKFLSWPISGKHCWIGLKTLLQY